MFFFTLKMVHNSIVILHKPHVWKKILFFSYGLKHCQPVFQYYLIINISGRNQAISQIFCTERIIREKYHLRLPFLVGFCQLYFLSNQISLFFDHQYLFKESINILVFLHGRKKSKKENVIKERKYITQIKRIHLRILLLVECGQLQLLSNQIAGFFDHQYL